MAERKQAKGTKQVGQAVEAELWASFVAFCQGRGQTIRRNLEEAIRRHMAHPPSLELPPLPPAPEVPARKRPK